MSRNLTRSLLSARQCELHHLRRCPSTQYQRLRNDDRPQLLHPRLAVSRCQRHRFSTSRSWQAAMSVTKATARKQAQPSMAVAREQAKQQALRDGSAITEDIGVVPNTMVFPMGRNRPSWFTNFKDRWRLERRRFAFRGMDLIQ